ERLTSASSSGVGVRVVKDGRLGYAYTADLSDAGLRECLAEARANLEVSGEDPGNVLPDPGAYEALDGLFDTRLADTDPERKVALALDLEARTRAADPKVTQVESARYGDVGGGGGGRSPRRWGWRGRSRSPTPGASRSPWPPRTATARSATPSTPPAPSRTSTRARWPGRRPTGPCACSARPSRRPGRSPWCSA